MFKEGYRLARAHREIYRGYIFVHEDSFFSFELLLLPMFAYWDLLYSSFSPLSYLFSCLVHLGGRMVILLDGIGGEGKGRDGVSVC